MTARLQDREYARLIELEAVVEAFLPLVKRAIDTLSCEVVNKTATDWATVTVALVEATRIEVMIRNARGEIQKTS